MVLHACEAKFLMMPDGLAKRCVLEENKALDEMQWVISSER